MGMCLKLNLLPLPFFTVRKTTLNIIPQSSPPMRYGNRYIYKIYVTALRKSNQEHNTPKSNHSYNRIVHQHSTSLYRTYYNIQSKIPNSG